MKLTDLDPRWSGEGLRTGMGVTFDCPVHRVHKCHVKFANPTDGGPPFPPVPFSTYRWQRLGETFETLTLSPSVNMQAREDGTIVDPTCWHGFIRNGDVT